MPIAASGSGSMRMSDKLQFVAGNDKLKLIGHQTDPLPNCRQWINLSALQKFSFKANWISRGLLLVDVMRPKSPGLMSCPVFESMLPPDDCKAFRLPIGLAKFT